MIKSSTQSPKMSIYLFNLQSFKGALCALGLLFVSCDEGSQLSSAHHIEAIGSNTSSRALKADQWEQEIASLGEAVPAVSRITLGELRGDSITPDQFISQFEALPIGFNISGDQTLREGVKGTLAAQRLVAKGAEGILREDRFVAKSTLSPKTWLDQGVLKSLLPAQIEAGAEIVFARLFETEAEAMRASEITPLDLPIDPESALALSEGVVVQLPLHAQVSFNLTGQQLSGSWSRFNQFHPWLTSSAVGFTSAVPRATAFFEGRQTITITRLEGTFVRVSVQRSQKSSLMFGWSGSAGINERLTVYPAALVERVKTIQARLNQWAKRPSEVLNGWAHRLELMRNALPTILVPLLDRAEEHAYPDQLNSLIEEAVARLDPALALLARGEEDLELASAWFEEKIEQTLGKVNENLNPIFARVKSFSERAFNINAVVSVNNEHLNELGIFGDYLIDLSTDEGVLAYQLMVGGRGDWDGPVASPDEVTSIDLTVADSLAMQEGRGVHRLGSAKLRSTRGALSLNASGPLTSWLHNSSTQRHELNRSIGDQDELWSAELWRVDRGWRAAYLDSSEVLLSGQIYREELEERDESWTHWLSWRRHWPQSAAMPVSEAIAEALNLTGTVGLKRGIPQVYYTDVSGALKAQLTVIYSQKLLDALVTVAEPDLLWAAAAETAAHFDNRFGLPFLSAFSVPSLSPNAALSCDTVAFHWGRGYCWMVDEDLIQPLVALRTTPLSLSERRAQQRAWLAELGQRGVLLNPIGSRVIARWIAEVATLLGLEDEVHIQFKLEHPTHPEVSVAVEMNTLTQAVSEQQHVALEIASWLGIGEGLKIVP